jgi:hypothetical protein
MGILKKRKFCEKLKIHNGTKKGQIEYVGKKYINLSNNNR